MGPRHSYVGSADISYSFHLIFSEDGTMRLSRGESSLKRGERSMAVQAKLPRTLFSTPTLKATIGVSGAPPSELKIDTVAAADALRGAIGCDIDLRVVRE